MDLINVVKTHPGWQKIKSKNCKQVVKSATLGKKEGLKYIAKLHVPIMPTTQEKEIVIGTTKYLLPYFVLEDYFITFAFESNTYQEDLNAHLIHCIGEKHFGNIRIRLVTTPDDLIDLKNNILRITGKEIKYLLDNFKNTKILKVKGEENLYFLELS